MNALGRWFLSGLLALGLLGCAPKHLQRVQGRLLNLYLLPQPRVGEIRAALRVEDRDYRIETDFQGRLTVTELATHKQQPVTLKPGPGKDLRGWITLPRPGGYTLDYVLESPGGTTLTARFFIKIPGKKS